MDPTLSFPYKDGKFIITTTHTFFGFFWLLPNGLVAFQDPIQEASVHYPPWLPRLLMAVTVSQAFLVSDDQRQSSGVWVRYFVECPSFEIWGLLFS